MIARQASDTVDRGHGYREGSARGEEGRDGNSVHWAGQGFLTLEFCAQYSHNRAAAHGTLMAKSSLNETFSR
jgi:hypothetical protein